jgi:outer membrane protein assembly factor BamA
MRFVKTVVLLIVGLVMAAGAWAQQPAQRYPIIAGITVEGLTEGADMATVIAYSGLRVGQEARPDDLVMAVRNLWNRRTFKDVRIERER